MGSQISPNPDSADQAHPGHAQQRIHDDPRTRRIHDVNDDAAARLEVLAAVEGLRQATLDAQDEEITNVNLSKLRFSDYFRSFSKLNEPYIVR